METGFPSPAREFAENNLNISDYLIKHPAATFFMKCGTTSVKDGLQKDDLLVVDKSLKPTNNSLAIVEHNGILCIRKFSTCTSYSDLSVWGVVSYVIRKAAK